MIAIVLFFLGFSLLLYVLLAGADFGAGILELFSSKENQAITKKTVYRVMGPVWEANHIWIIILIVILWIGFPKYYYIIVTALHIPITLLLLGITLRGVAFVFRHYDAYKDKSQILYDWMFKISSVVTPIFLGITFGAILYGKIIVTEDLSNYSFFDLYVSPWFNLFSLLIGLFFAVMCSFLSAIFLIGETDDLTRKVYIKKARYATIVIILLGLIVLSYSFYLKLLFIYIFISSIYSMTVVVLSAVLLFPLWRSIKKGKKVISRSLAGLQVLLILSAVLVPLFPKFLYTNENALSILDNIAPNSVINVLAITLLIGGFVILPGLFHLLKSFNMIKILEK